MFYGYLLVNMSDCYLALISILDKYGVNNRIKLTFAFSKVDAESWIIENLKQILDGDLHKMFHHYAHKARSTTEILLFFQDEIIPELDLELREANPNIDTSAVDWIVTAAVPDGREFETSSGTSLREIDES
ncbi:hypothetical protein GEMRC1_013872 [Eukaryota sp. GEM-RC1]